MSETHSEYEQWLEAAARPTRDHGGTGVALALFALAAIVAIVVL